MKYRTSIEQTQATDRANGWRWSIREAQRREEMVKQAVADAKTEFDQVNARSLSSIRR